ncbi:MAG: hypothetical protein Fur0016_19150 [Anaerolineales bacterium]
MTHYKTLLSHPLVIGITWWDMTDGGWLKAPAGLLRRDAFPKPAYNARLKLVKGEWWFPPTRMITDSHGQVTFEGFMGEYELSLQDQKFVFALNTLPQTEISVHF